MSRPRTRLPWLYDEKTQQFTTPAGVVTLSELAALRYGVHTSQIDLTGPWTGYRVRGSRLLMPHSSQALRPDTARLFSAWVEQGEHYWSNCDAVRKVLAKAKAGGSA